MKIAIIGTGAMGSIYAGLLAEGGHDVRAIDLWADHVEAIHRHGLRIEGPSGNRTATGIRASRDPDIAADCDLFVIATKARDVGAASRAIAPVLHPGAVVLTIQNGLGAGERIAEFLPFERVLLGVAEGFGASVVGPGHVRHTAMRHIHLGDPAAGLSERLERVANAWRQGGFDVCVHEELTPFIWEKFLCNVTLSGPCTAIGCRVDELLADPDRWAVGLGCMREAHTVGRAQGVVFSFDDPETHVTTFARALGKARPSMLLDHMARRRSELEAINGQVSSRGRLLGIATPFNDTICTIIRAREAAFDDDIR